MYKDKIDYLISKLSVFFNDENISNIKDFSEDFSIYSLGNQSEEEKEKYVKFLRLIWLTTVYQVQFLTSSELRDSLSEGVMYKYNLTVYSERLKLIGDIVGNDKNKKGNVFKFVEKMENILAKNQKKDLLLLTYNFFLETNPYDEVDRFFKEALKVPDLKTENDEIFYLKNKEMINYVESVSKIFDIEENLKYLNKFLFFKKREEFLINGKNKIALKEDNEVNHVILNKLSYEFQKNGIANLNLEQILTLEKAYRIQDLSSLHSKIILNAIALIKENSEDVDDLFKNISEEVASSSLYKESVSDLIGKIENKEVIKSFLSEYIKGCIFNNIDNIDLSDFRNSIIQNNQFVKIWTDCESQSLIEIDTKKLLNYVRKTATKELELLNYEDVDIDFSEEDKLVRKIIKLNIDIENRGDINFKEFGVNYKDRFDGVNYGELNSKDLILNKMKLFINYLNTCDVKSSLTEGEKNIFYISLEHGYIKKEDVLDLIMAAITTSEPNPLDKNYNLLLREEFNKNVAYKVHKFDKYNEDEDKEYASYENRKERTRKLKF